MMKRTFLFAAVLAAQPLSTALAESPKASLATGISYDSNAYRAPSSDYVDFFAAPNGSTIVDPDVQSGFFIPVEFEAETSLPLSNSINLIGSYNYSGRSYLDSDLDNADQDVHQFNLDTEYTISNTSSSRSRITAGINYNEHDRVYYDRDSGEKKTSGSALEDVSDRYTYDSTGGILQYEYWKKKNYRLKLTLRSEQRDHELTPTGFEYDHRYNRVDIDYSSNISRGNKLYLKYAYYMRDYDDRRARNLSGQLFSSSPILEYSYHDFGIKYKHSISKKLELRYAASYTTREDDYQGYNDYDLFDISLAAKYDISNTLMLKSKITYWDQDYPNAWNFDRDPSRFVAITDTSNKSADGVRIEATLSYRFDKNRYGYIDIKYSDNNNTDDRYEYERALITMGVDWGFNL